SFSLLLLQPPQRSPLFPYTTLFRSRASPEEVKKLDKLEAESRAPATIRAYAAACKTWENWCKARPISTPACPADEEDLSVFVTADRKSTRLNSSHLVISYAVFCLKK